ncbi:hypothetical protein PQD71_gp200 [Kosakonia phage Kc263]|uniref:Uncharacterized protein n=1 Tax=Kosakonia phage Kc263 TaxID=2863194 RepID=A0AAE7WFG4_9CAUD|nr:hypothetical protein PQD71_gp200 [Kosakonia phage Kc263]QYN80126.1 hypothetical protein [Kosakonia phage Kc263]
MERVNFEVEGFEALRGEVNHVLNILAGMENLREAGGDKYWINEEGAYTNGVMNLYNIDLGSYAGQESFLDHIKAAGNKIYEWIKALIISIKNFFTGKPSKGADAAASDAIELAKKLEPRLVVKEITDNIAQPAKLVKEVPKLTQEIVVQKNDEANVHQITFEDTAKAFIRELEESTKAEEKKRLEEEAKKKAATAEFLEAVKVNVDKINDDVCDIAFHYLHNNSEEYEALDRLMRLRPSKIGSEFGFVNFEKELSGSQALEKSLRQLKVEKLGVTLQSINQARGAAKKQSLDVADTLNKLNEKYKNSDDSAHGKDLKFLASIQKSLVDISTNYDKIFIEADITIVKNLNQLTNKAHREILNEVRKHMK